ncbi:hypothetical protein EDD86DRAFT_245671 [Gorgonomyces haynaldii]|nr:hypothetical protein EDD86DRAFT_245394 [Gorgonomyces haynaldii]KAI8912813.1 hypothetical protein EDD86DRAFT_245671 [Gorgonomyces haynaldii]
MQPLRQLSFISEDFFSNTKPVMVVCGWMDAKPRPVMKYCQLYQEMGFRVVCLLSTSSTFFLPAYFVHREAAALLREHLDQVHVHLMSNGGCSSWIKFKSHLPLLKPLSFVLDSCPTMPGKNLSMNAFYTGKPIWQQFLLALILKPIEYIGGLRTWLFPNTHVFEVQFQKLFVPTRQVPKMFLYSKGDTVVRSESVEKAIERCRSIKTPVESFDFGPDSQHVAHFMSHPMEYRKLLAGFHSKFQ